jgi:hypothetical protein
MQLQQSSCKQTHNKQCRIQNTVTRGHKITNVPSFFFYMALGLHDFDAGNPLLGPLEGVGPEILTFLGPNGTPFACFDFQGTPLPIALEMDFPASKSLRPASYKQHVH